MPFCTLAQRCPVEGFRQVDFDVLGAALFDQLLLRVDRQDALRQRALEGLVGAALVGQVAGSLDRVVADGFHGLVGEGDGRVRTVGDVLQVQGVLEAHDAQADRTVLEVGVLRLRDRVVVDVDDVIEHAYRGLDGLLQLGGVQLAVDDVVDQVDRAQVADGDLVLVGVQGDLGAEVRAVAPAAGLRRLHGSLKVSHGWPVSSSMEHLAPQVLGLDDLVQLQLAVAGQGLVVLVALLEGLAVEVVQSGTSDGERGQEPSSKTRFMNRSGIQLAVFMSWVRRRSSPVFLRSSRNSSMSRCQVSR